MKQIPSWSTMSINLVGKLVERDGDGCSFRGVSALGVSGPCEHFEPGRSGVDRLGRRTVSFSRPYTRAELDEISRRETELGC